MASISAYELHRFREGRWSIDSIYDDRDLALSEGRNVLKGKYASGVRVIEETFDADSGETSTRIIFQGRKGEDRAPRPFGPQERKVSARPTKTEPLKAKPSATSSAVTLVLALGGIGLAAIIGLVVLLDYAG